jgi:hypothetical protein
MGNISTSAGRIVVVAFFVFVALSTSLFPPTGLRVAAAQDYEAMMPNSLLREAHKAHHQYLEAIQAVNAAQSERLARQTAGAPEAELRELDVKVAALVSKAEKLKVLSDYLEELYKAKEREYEGK